MMILWVIGQDLTMMPGEADTPQELYEVPMKGTLRLYMHTIIEVMATAGAKRPDGL